MDEKQNQEKKIGYDKDTFGEINQGGYAQNNPYGQNHQYGQSKAQGDYAGSLTPLPFKNPSKP